MVSRTRAQRPDFRPVVTNRHAKSFPGSFGSLVRVLGCMTLHAIQRSRLLVHRLMAAHALTMIGRQNARSAQLSWLEGPAVATPARGDFLGLRRPHIAPVVAPAAQNRISS